VSKPRQSKAEKVLDKEIDRLYKHHAAYRSINIMDIPNVFADAKAHLAAGGTLEDGVKVAVAKYCKAA